jgi:hypothetical protein
MVHGQPASCQNTFRCPRHKTLSPSKQTIQRSAACAQLAKLRRCSLAHAPVAMRAPPCPSQVHKDSQDRGNGKRSMRKLSVCRAVPIAHTRSSLLRVRTAQHRRMRERAEEVAMVRYADDHVVSV